MNIKTVVLNSGLEIVCNYSQAPVGPGSGHKVRLDKPFKMEVAFIPQADPRTGQLAHIMAAPQLVPLLGSVIESHQYLDLDTNQILAVKETTLQISAAYFKMTTGLDMPSPGQSIALG